MVSAWRGCGLASAAATPPARVGAVLEGERVGREHAGLGDRAPLELGDRLAGVRAGERDLGLPLLAGDPPVRHRTGDPGDEDRGGGERERQPQPADEPARQLDRRVGVGLDPPAVEEAGDLERHRGRVGVPAGGVGGGRLGDDRRQLGRQLGRAVDDVVGDGGAAERRRRRIALRRAGAGDQLAQDHAERPHVRARVGGGATRLLGAHVAGRADRARAGGERRAAQRERELVGAARGPGAAVVGLAGEGDGAVAVELGVVLADRAGEQRALVPGGEAGVPVQWRLTEMPNSGAVTAW
jgi:hypothetical protein